MWRKSKKICLVDEDTSMLKAMSGLLAGQGLAVRSFNEPGDFLAHAASHPVPVLVLDIWMRHITGLEVLARLCALSPHTRVIVVTGRDDSAVRATAMPIGPTAFFVKPFDDDEFLRAIYRALAQARRSPDHSPIRH